MKKRLPSVGRGDHTPPRRVEVKPPYLAAVFVFRYLFLNIVLSYQKEYNLAREAVKK